MEKNISKNGYIRTDLACECGTPTDAATGEEGLLYEETETAAGMAAVSRLEVLNATGSEKIGRPVGKYVTLALPSSHIWQLSRCEKKELQRVLAGEIERFADDLCGVPDAGTLRKKHCKILLIGLGNRELTADSVGPLTLDRVQATRHLRRQDSTLFESLEACEVTVLSPGVMGQTGLEVAEQVCATVDLVHPDLILTVDALAARDRNRLGATFQLSDAGITPGSGVGNHRMPIDRQTLGVPVLSLGVPTVVSSATLLWDALEQVGLDEKAAETEWREVLDAGTRFFVTPKESDLLSATAAEILSGAISEVFLGQKLEAVL